MLNKNTKNYKLKVGYTVFIGLVIFFIFIIMVGTEGYYFSKTYKLNLLVKNTGGLIEGSKVYLGGLKIGQIDKIEFTSVNNQNLVLIRLNLLKKYSQQITVKSYATIETSGLLGDKLINISLGNPTEKALNEGDYLPVKESFSLDKLSDKIEPLIENIDKFTSNIASITDSLRNEKEGFVKLMLGKETTKSLEKILTNLNSFTTSINNKNGTVGKLINNDELYSNLSDLTTDLKSLTETINSGKGTVGKLVKNDSLYANLNNLSFRLNKASESLQNDSTFIGGMIKNKEGYKKLLSLIDELNKLITDIKENPKKYVNLSIF
ncbi:MlaD family protein [Melioribacteraceae bacterium 4301-Me]|uniref:MlaD family protein n=1 Tax=Pyranulibacter aquaticus TaxID=3163344 RepID=UPI003595B9A8